MSDSTVTSTSGFIRPFVVTDDTRGPDSVECMPGSIGGDEMHQQCWGDYTVLGTLGFWCGCNCHDAEPETEGAHDHE